MSENAFSITTWNVNSLKVRLHHVLRWLEENQPDVLGLQETKMTDDVFPAAEKEMVRAMLSESLRAVISQTLLKKVGGGRIAAHEIMIGTPAIRNLIREGKIAQMYSAIQTGQAAGMHTLDQNLADLMSKGLINKEEARFKAVQKENF